MGASLQNSGGRSRRRGRRKSALMSEINVTPFVDVMLVLLIIFMVTAPLIATGMKVNLPNSDISQLQSNKQDEPIQVIVDKNGKLYINKNRVVYGELSQMLKSITKENRNAHIYVKGDKDTSYGNVIKAISSIHDAGYPRVGLVTQPKASK